MTPTEINYFVQKRREGWENSQVRKELVSQGMSKDDVFYYLNQIDDLYLESTKNQLNGLISKRIQISIKMLFGFLLITLSVIPIYFSIQSEEITFVKIVGAMVLSGMTLIINAKRQKRKTQNKNQSVKIKRNYKSKSFLDIFKGNR